MEDNTPVFTTASGTPTTTTVTDQGTEGNYAFFSPTYSGRSANEILAMLAQQEPKTADTAPPTSDFEDVMMNLRLNGADLPYDDTDANQNYYMGSQTESMSSRSNMWTETGSTRQSSNDQMSTFDFLVKSVSAANNYVSMLTREQLSVLQCLRPSLLYEFLQEIARVRSDKRMRRALPNECAFCKNNGENEECYSSHSLKDWRGRVLCPVLRAFRCPRCSATGDRAHTIKYCPENNEQERNVSGVSSRRRGPVSSLLLGGSQQSAPPPSPHAHAGPQTGPQSPPPDSPSTGLGSNIWSSFGFH